MRTTGYLQKKIDINKIINNKALEIILRAYKYKYTKLALSPSVWKYDLYKIFAGKLDVNINPEVQLRNKKFSKAFTKKSIVTVGNNIIVKDIGRKWLRAKGLKKAVKSSFTQY